MVEELAFEEMEPFIAEMTRREPWGTEPGIAETLAAFRRVLVEGVGARFFAQRIDGRSQARASSTCTATSPRSRT